MRIARLELAAYGHFADLSLDFTTNPGGLQVIYGANAAGKSTALRAIAAVLFGIPDRTADDFRHAYDKLRLGATLVAADGRSLSFTRLKKRKDPLLGADGTPLAEATLRAFLGNAERGLFESMFGLDHARLQVGADDLQRMGGAAGESLLEAVAGTRSVRVVLAELEAEAGEIFKRHGSKQRLPEALQRLNDARRRMREAALAGEKYRALEDEFARIESALTEDQGELDRLNASLHRLQRIERNHPRVARRQGVLRALEPLATVPELPPESTGERLEQLERRRNLQLQIDRDSHEATTLRQDLAKLVVAPELAALLPDVEALGEQAPVIAKEVGDLPNRHRERDELQRAAEAAFARARPGLSIAAALLLPLAAPEEARLAQLIDESKELDIQAKAADEALQEAQRAAAQAEEALTRLPAAIALDALLACLDVHRAARALPEQLGQARQQQAALQDELTKGMAGLPHWSGSAELLAQLAVPAVETRRRVAADLDAATQALRRADERHAEQVAALAQAAHLLEAEARSVDLPSLASLQEARDKRDREWTLLRRVYVDAGGDAAARAADSERVLAAAYEGSVRQADSIADRLCRDAERVARMETLHCQQELARQRLDQLTAERLDAGRALSAAQERWQALWLPLQVDPLPPLEMDRWLEQRQGCVQLHEHVRALARQVEELAERVRDAEQELEAALSVSAVAPATGASLATILAHAAGVVEEERRRGKERDKAQATLELQRGSLERTRSQRAALAQRHDRWRSAWAAVVQPFGFTEATTPVEVAAFLRCFAEGRQALEDGRKVAGRIVKMEEDRDGFVAELDSLVRRIAADATHRTLSEKVAALRAWAETARAAMTQSQEKTQRLHEVETMIATAGEELLQVDERLQQMTSRAGCARLEELPDIERAAAEKVRLAEELRRLEEELVRDGAGRELEAVVAETASVDGDHVAGAIVEVERQRQERDAERGGRQQRRGELSRDLQAMRAATDTAARAAEDAAAEMATVQAAVDELVRLRLAEATLRAFVERYRARHQDPLLVRAGEMFAPLTLGAFVGVRTDETDKGEQVLCGVRPDGTTQALATMSEGTCYQLYLALRLAAVEQFVAAAEPLPFVADDLLIHFDDDRARAALRVFADLSQRTQVLFFTHHRHLVDLAREVVAADRLSVLTLP